MNSNNQFFVARKPVDAKSFTVQEMGQAIAANYKIVFKAKSHVAAQRALALMVLMEYEKNRTISEEDLCLHYGEFLTDMATDLKEYLAKNDSALYFCEEAIDVYTVARGTIYGVFSTISPRFRFFKSSLRLPELQQREPTGNITMYFQSPDSDRVTRVFALLAVLEKFQTHNSFYAADQQDYVQHIKALAEMVDKLMRKQALKRQNDFMDMIQSASLCDSRNIVIKSEPVETVSPPSIDSLPSTPLTTTPLNRNQVTPSNQLFSPSNLPTSNSSAEPRNHTTPFSPPVPRTAPPHGQMRPKSLCGSDLAAASKTTQSTDLSKQPTHKSTPAAESTKRPPKAKADWSSVFHEDEPPRKTAKSDRFTDYSAPEMQAILAFFYSKVEALGENDDLSFTDCKPTEQELNRLSDESGYPRHEILRLLTKCHLRLRNTTHYGRSLSDALEAELKRYLSPSLFQHYSRRSSKNKSVTKLTPTDKPNETLAASCSSRSSDIATPPITKKSVEVSALDSQNTPRENAKPDQKASCFTDYSSPEMQILLGFFYSKVEAHGANDNLTISKCKPTEAEIRRLSDESGYPRDQVMRLLSKCLLRLRKAESRHSISDAMEAEMKRYLSPSLFEYYVRKIESLNSDSPTNPSVHEKENETTPAASSSRSSDFKTPKTAKNSVEVSSLPSDNPTRESAKTDRFTDYSTTEMQVLLTFFYSKVEAYGANDNLARSDCKATAAEVERLSDESGFPQEEVKRLLANILSRFRNSLYYSRMSESLEAEAKRYLSPVVFDYYKTKVDSSKNKSTPKPTIMEKANETTPATSSSRSGDFRTPLAPRNSEKSVEESSTPKNCSEHPSLVYKRGRGADYSTSEMQAILRYFYSKVELDNGLMCKSSWPLDADEEMRALCKDTDKTEEEMKEMLARCATRGRLAFKGGLPNRTVLQECQSYLSPATYEKFESEYREAVRRRNGEARTPENSDVGSAYIRDGTRFPLVAWFYGHLENTYAKDSVVLELAEATRSKFPSNIIEQLKIMRNRLRSFLESGRPRAVIAELEHFGISVEEARKKFIGSNSESGAPMTTVLATVPATVSDTVDATVSDTASATVSHTVSSTVTDTVPATVAVPSTSASPDCEETKPFAFANFAQGFAVQNVMSTLVRQVSGQGAEVEAPVELDDDDDDDDVIIVDVLEAVFK